MKLPKAVNAREFALHLYHRAVIHAHELVIVLVADLGKFSTVSILLLAAAFLIAISIQVALAVEEA